MSAPETHYNRNRLSEEQRTGTQDLTKKWSRGGGKSDPYCIARGPVLSSARLGNRHQYDSKHMLVIAIVILFIIIIIMILTFIGMSYPMWQRLPTMSCPSFSSFGFAAGCELTGRHSSQEAFHMENLHLVQGPGVLLFKKHWNSVGWQELNPTWDEEDCI